MTAKTEETPFDLSALDFASACDNPFEFEVVFPETHPREGQGTGIFISVVGAQSATFQGIIREEMNRAQAEQWRKRRANKNDGPMPVEEQEAKINEAIAYAVTGWRTVRGGKSEPVLYDGSTPLEFSRKNCIHVLSKYDTIRDQVNKATADLSNFIKA